MKIPFWVWIIAGVIVIGSITLNVYYITMKPPIVLPSVVTNNVLQPYPVTPDAPDYALIAEINRYRTEPFTITNQGRDMYRIGLADRFGVIKFTQKPVICWNILTVGIDTSSQVFAQYQRRFWETMPFYLGCIINYNIQNQDIKLGVLGSLVF